MEVEKGKTAKYLREKLGGIPEQAKENLKAFNAIKKQILEALKDEDLTIKQLTEKLNMPSDEVVYYLMSLALVIVSSSTGIEQIIAFIYSASFAKALRFRAIMKTA